MDPTGLSAAAGLFTTLGPTAGAIAVVWFFLQFLRDEAQRQRDANHQMLEQLKAEGEKRDAAWRDIVSQHLEAMREFSRSVHAINLQPSKKDES